MTAMGARNGLRHLLAIFGFATSTVFAQVPVLDDVQAMYTSEGTFLRDLNLKTIEEIRARDRAGQPIQGWALGGLISGLRHESEKQIVSAPDVARRKIDLALHAASEWRPSFGNWHNIVLGDEGALLMMRWFLSGDEADRRAAIAKFEEKDESEPKPNEKGHGAYYLGAAYESLFGWAAAAGRSRDEQIALLRAGIEANKAGRAKYPFDSTIGLSALYGKLEFVSGGSALPLYVDEWVNYISSQPEKVQIASSNSIAEALFQMKRDDEALKWYSRYVKYWAHADVRPELRARLMQSRCLSASIGKGFREYTLRNPQTSSELRARICEGRE